MQVRLVGRVVLVSLLSLAVLGAGCRRQPVAVQPPPPPPAAPPPAAPTVTLQAAPATVQQGQSVTLTWSSSNATTLNLAPGVGSVAPQGSTSASPTASVTYMITATGPGGTADASARVTVTPPPPPPPPPPPQPTLDELFTRGVRDSYFDYDRADIRPDAREALSQTAQFLRSNPQVRVTIEGHCDERGSTEYNLALGDRRAQATKDFLVSLGVTADRMDTVSYGKERPTCADHNEGCWQQNRRGHFVRR
ncbi:MAG TPA: peptidoglycan-associated lipoprotein Pal [Anaerolineales bacterium]